MKKNIFILISLVFLTAGYAFAGNHSVHIEWTYDYQPEGRILAGYRLYKEGAEICANNTPTSNYMDCTFESEEGTFEFTLTSFCDDGSESPHSEPFTFTLSESLNSELAASFTTAPISLSGIAPFTVSYDGSSSSGAISYRWEFGDGDMSNESRTEHIFAVAGTYTSTLTVTDRQGNINTKSVTVTVSDPSGSEFTASFITDPTSLLGIVPFTVAFDATSSTGDISSYNWNFGDGSSGGGTQVSHTYTTAGSFSAVLTVTSSNGSTNQKDAIVNVGQAAVAVIAATPVSLIGNTPFTVFFDATGSTGDISSYSWDFGDGSFGDGAQISHTYTTTGSFSAVLTVTSSNGSTNQKDVTVNVGQAPVAVIAATPVSLSGETPFTVSFDATGSTGDISSYSWDFGDGNFGDGAQISHTYTTTGSFSAVLTVTSSNGSTSQKDITITTTTSVTEIVNIHVEWSYDPQITDECLLSGYSLYQEGVKVCTSDTPGDRAMDCSFVSQPGTYNFTLTALCDDGSESPHSEPFAFTLSESSSSELTASFATHPTSLSGTAPFTVSYDGSSSSGAVSYTWEFGDGHMSNESRTEHIFTAAGTYTSTLTVTDRQDNINTKSVIVNVNESSGSALTASFVTDPISLSGTAPFTVSYDGSSSSGAVSYTWGFGDGDVSSGSQTEHIYLTAGIYTSTLTVTDSQSNINTKSVIVTVAEDLTENTPPTAVIESSATAGTVPLNVSFTGSGSHDTKGSIIAYLWNFGDGSPTASGSTTSHQYTVEGTYNASLKVTDNQGATDTVSTSIIVTGPQPENQVPTAKITTSTTQGSVPLTVTFDGSASTDPENGSLTYSWNFGDGAFDQGEVVHHTYNMPGSVTATLTVTDSMGAVDNTSTTIKVLPGFSFEVGEVEIDNNWVRVEITENFVNPIVVTGSPSSNDSQPCVIRLRNIDKTGFEIRLQEWDYLDGKHSSETVAYLILEQGRFTLKNGTLVEAGQFDSQNNNFHSVSFAAAFATEPIIMTSIASFNEGDAVTGRIKNISLKSFEHKIQEQESFSNGHSNETVNYVAWEVSKVTFGNFNAIVDRTARTVKNKWYTIPYNEILPNLPIFLGTMQSQNEADTAAIRYRNKSTSDIQIKIEEETSADRDTRHTTESVGYFLFW